VRSSSSTPHPVVHLQEKLFSWPGKRGGRWWRGFGMWATGCCCLRRRAAGRRRIPASTPGDHGISMAVAWTDPTVCSAEQVLSDYCEQVSSLWASIRLRKRFLPLCAACCLPTFTHVCFVILSIDRFVSSPATYPSTQT